MSYDPSSAGGYSNRSSLVGFGSSASTNAVRSDSDASTGSSNSSEFKNPWAVAKSEMGHLGIPGGKLVGGLGSGSAIGISGGRLLPQSGAGEDTHSCRARLD